MTVSQKRQYGQVPGGEHLNDTFPNVKVNTTALPCFTALFPMGHCIKEPRTFVTDERALRRADKDRFITRFVTFYSSFTRLCTRVDKYLITPFQNDSNGKPQSWVSLDTVYKPIGNTLNYNAECSQASSNYQWCTIILNCKCIQSGNCIQMYFLFLFFLEGIIVVTFLQEGGVSTSQPIIVKQQRCEGMWWH